jgi:hypothetical protein
MSGDMSCCSCPNWLWHYRFGGCHEGAHTLSAGRPEQVPYDMVVQDKIVSDPDYFVRWSSDAGPVARKAQKCPEDGCKSGDVCYNYISSCFNDKDRINSPTNNCSFKIRAAA